VRSHPFVFLTRDGTIRSNYTQLQPTQSPPVSPNPKPESINLRVRVLYMMDFDSRAHFMIQSPRTDLISLESPFIAEPRAGDVTTSEAGDHDENQDFAGVWDAATAFSARGWCDGTLDAVVRRLQGLGFPRGLSVLPADQPPFEGDLKVLILGDLDRRGRAVLRLHESPDNDEDGCLWRMRSEDEAVLGAVKQVLAE